MSRRDLARDDRQDLNSCCNFHRNQSTKLTLFRLIPTLFLLRLPPLRVCHLASQERAAASTLNRIPSSQPSLHFALRSQRCQPQRLSHRSMFPLHALWTCNLSPSIRLMSWMRKREQPHTAQARAHDRRLPSLANDRAQPPKQPANPLLSRMLSPSLHSAKHFRSTRQALQASALPVRRNLSALLRPLQSRKQSRSRVITQALQLMLRSVRLLPRSRAETPVCLLLPPKPLPRDQMTLRSDRT